jgi:hypothetical protein
MSLANSRVARLTMVKSAVIVAVTIFCTAAGGVAGESPPDGGIAGRYEWRQARELKPGLRYARRETREPRRVVVHAIRIDTMTPGLRLHTTPRRADWVPGKTETDRQTTRDFLRESRRRGQPMVFAVNADAFSPWPAPYNLSTPTDLLGLAVADGVLVSRGAGTPSLVKRKSGTWRIEATSAETDTAEIELAVSGFALCLEEGKAIVAGDDLHPRTGIGVSSSGQQLIIVAIDGRQPASLGATTGELGEWLRHFGADRGINMDGGGSTTFAWWDPLADGDDKCRLLNRPVGNGANYSKLDPTLFQATERANGNNLGVSFDGP